MTTTGKHPLGNLGHFAHPPKKQTAPQVQIAKAGKGDMGRKSTHKGGR